jgi:hypothetical protein
VKNGARAAFIQSAIDFINDCLENEVGATILSRVGRANGDTAIRDKIVAATMG